MSRATVTFIPDELEIEVEPGTSLLEAADRAGIVIRSNCGGDGTCGRCGVILRSGQLKAVASRRDPERVVACRSLVLGDCVIEIPADSRVDTAQVLTDRSGRGVLAERDLCGSEDYPLDPLVTRHTLAVSPATLTENASDLARVTAQLRRELEVERVEFDLEALRQLPVALRQGDWTITVAVSVASDAATVIDVRPGQGRPLYGLAIDVGTTTIVTLLVELATGLTVDRRGEYNRQSRHGDDVITRIVHATDCENGLADLQWAAIDTINHLIAGACLAAGVEADQIVCAVIAGNTTMTTVLAGVTPKYLRLEPYIPPAARFPELRASELGLSIHQRAAVHLIPCVASYVGGDIVAGALVTGVGRRDEVELLVDIGTNGEILIGNRDWLVSCACSAGPCFEGSGITCGMRAEPGAIQRISVGSPDQVTVSTVGGAPARGICGSGLVDAMARLAESGIIDRAGHFAAQDSPRVRTGDEGQEYLLASAVAGGSDVVLREPDIQNVLRAKAAVYAGIRCLLSVVELDIDAIDRLFVAGGFGNYLVLEDAVTIGLLPDIDYGRYEFAGNTSVKGARLALLSRRAYRDAKELASRITYIELSVGGGFMDEFISAMFLPHTDLSQFPSIRLNGRQSAATEASV